jgi:hypothetical protein
MNQVRWETIERSNNDMTERMKVPGGWIVCRTSGWKFPLSHANWFVPDSEHTWEVEILSR